MKRWYIKISGYAPQENTVADISDSQRYDATTRTESGGINEVDVTEFTTDLKWSNALTSPYEQGAVSLVVPFAEARQLVGLGSVEGGVFRPHASGWLTILEDVSGTLRTRFYGPVTRVSSGVQVDAKTGARNTIKLKVDASSWLSVMSRGFKVAAQDSLSVAGPLISLSRWGEITGAIFNVASQGLPTSFEEAWNRLASLHKTPQGSSLNVFAFPIARSPDVSVEVQGRNVSQIQTPSFATSLWGILTSTFQASEFIELFPRWDYSKGASDAQIVYRMRPPSARVGALAGIDALEAMGFSNPLLPSFFPDSFPAPVDLGDVERFSVEYNSSNRTNYIEVTSPYAGASSLAGLSSDPLVLREDVRRYGLHEYSAEYPYIRDTEGAVRDQLNELNSYAALLFAEAYRYGAGSVDTTYESDRAQVGEWVRWASYGAESVQLEGYCTAVTHRVQVNKEGAVTASSSWTVERVSTYQRSDT